MVTFLSLYFRERHTGAALDACLSRKQNPRFLKPAARYVIVSQIC
jgi:hypothetical protein